MMTKRCHDPDCVVLAANLHAKLRQVKIERDAANHKYGQALGRGAQAYSLATSQEAQRLRAMGATTIGQVEAVEYRHEAAECKECKAKEQDCWLAALGHILVKHCISRVEELDAKLSQGEAAKLRFEELKSNRDSERIEALRRCDKLERQRNTGDCRPNNGWLSDDLECGIDVEPACFYHLWKQRERQVMAMREELRIAVREYHGRHEHSGPLQTCMLGNCPGYRAALSPDVGKEKS